MAVSASRAGADGEAPAFAAGSGHRFRICRFGALFGRKDRSVIPGFPALKVVRVAVEVEGHLQVFAESRTAVGAAVGIILEEADKAVYNIVAYGVGVCLHTAGVIHPDESAVVHVSSAGVVTPNCDVISVYVGSAAGENASHELLAA